MFPSSIRFPILSLPMSPSAITHILTFTVHNAAINRSLLAEKRGKNAAENASAWPTPKDSSLIIPFAMITHPRRPDKKNCSFNGSFYGFPFLLSKPNSTHLAPLTLSLCRPRFGRKHLATLLNWGHNLYLISDFLVLRTPPSSLREGGKMDPFAKFRSTHSQPSRLVVRFSVDSFFSLIFATSSQNRPTLSPNERAKLSIMLRLYPLTNRRAYPCELFAATPEDIVPYSPSPWDRCTAAWRVSNTFLIYVHKMCTHE